MLHAAIPLWILVAIVAWMASKPWREQRRQARELRRAYAMLYPQLNPTAPQPQPAPRCSQQTGVVHRNNLVPGLLQPTRARGDNGRRVAGPPLRLRQQFALASHATPTAAPAVCPMH